MCGEMWVVLTPLPRSPKLYTIDKVYICEPRRFATLHDLSTRGGWKSGGSFVHLCIRLRVMIELIGTLIGIAIAFAMLYWMWAVVKSIFAVILFIFHSMWLLVTFPFRLIFRIEI